MPLRDHFRPPLDNLRHPEGFLATWPVAIVARLHAKMAKQYHAAPWVQTRFSDDIDVAIADEEGAWKPTRPWFTVPADLPAQDIYEVRVFDDTCRGLQVAAIEIVSPFNKEYRSRCRTFAAKCAALLQQRVSVVIVDVVTTYAHSVYAELLDIIGRSDLTLHPEPPSLHVVACRTTKHARAWLLEVWSQPLTLGQPLPTMPLWLADNLAVPLELEESYEQSCSILGIP